MFSVAMTASISAFIFHFTFYSINMGISILIPKVQVILYFIMLSVFPMCKSMQKEIARKTAHGICTVNPVPYTFLFNSSYTQDNAI